MTAPTMRARATPRWKLASTPDAALVTQLASEVHLPPLVCGLLVSRGYGDPESAKTYLRPRLEQLHAPELMLGMDAAVDRLRRSIESGETILVHGDYDVDGICSATILVKVLRHLGGKAVPFIPHRLRDGYDFTDAGVEAAVREGARLVVTCDCGTSAHTPLGRLAALGIDAIVTDHHLPSRPVPECVAVLNPRQPGCSYPDKDLCAAGVVFKLAVALLRSSGASENIALHMLDLVALATVADVAPLRGENRILVRYGLRLMAETKNIGLRALLAATGLDGGPLTAGKVGFILAPRLNASGRVGHAMRGVELLMATDQAQANAIARELEELNRARQELDRDTLVAARAMALGLDLDATYGIVLGAEGWHAGVIGIVASRLVEEFTRPVMLVALDGGVGKGSGRSIPAFDLHGGLVACSDLLLRFGGHRAAAGITVAADRLPEFAARFNAVARERLTPEDLVPELRVDLEVAIEHVSDELEALLRHFEPFGIGNPAPLLAARQVQVGPGGARVVGQGGLKFSLVSAEGAEKGKGRASAGSGLEVIGWGMGEMAPDLAPGSTIDVAFRLERDTFNGQQRLVARLSDLRR